MSRPRSFFFFGAVFLSNPSVIGALLLFPQTLVPPPAPPPIIRAPSAYQGFATLCVPPLWLKFRLPIISVLQIKTPLFLCVPFSLILKDFGGSLLFFLVQLRTLPARSDISPSSMHRGSTLPISGVTFVFVENFFFLFKFSLFKPVIGSRCTRDGCCSPRCHRKD